MVSERRLFFSLIFVLKVFEREGRGSHESSVLDFRNFFIFLFSSDKEQPSWIVLVMALYGKFFPHVFLSIGFEKRGGTHKGSRILSFLREKEQPSLTG